MQKINKYILFLGVMMFTASLSNPAYAQKKGGQQKKQHSKASIITLSAKVLNKDNNAVKNAIVSSGEGSMVVMTDSNGEFTITARTNDKILIEAFGFDPYVYDVAKEAGNKVIVIDDKPIYADLGSMVTLPMNNEEYKRYIVGAVSSVDGSSLKSYPDAIVGNTLQGKLLGLSSIMTSGGLANNPSSMYIRGLHRSSDNGVIVLIDGIERPLNDLLTEEVESVEVLKDATSKILYGARSANGVILIKTKRGAKHKRIMNVNIEAGVGLATKMPEYLDSYNYATLYNEARANDGLSPFYTDKDLDGYKNSKGVNDLRYPNIDYYDYFLNSNTNYRKADFEFSGGNDNAQYALIGGYVGNSGLQSVGKTPQRNRFNVRGNLDMKINEIVSSFIGISGVFDLANQGSLDHASTFSALSTHRPNEYPLILDSEYMIPDSTGYPSLGASMNQANNLYGSLVYGGKVKNQSISGQLNLGLNFDFDKYVKGLSAKAYLAFDNYFTGKETLSTSAPAYAQRWVQGSQGQDSVIFIQRKLANKNDQFELSNSYNNRRSGIIGTINYNNVFNEVNRISADLSYYYYQAQFTGYDQDTKTANTSLRVNYSYADKYIAEGSTALMGSNRFNNDNRYFMAYAGGLAWIISEEDFLKENRNIDFLKIKASAGILGYDAKTDYFLYDNRWSDNGTITFNNQNKPNRVTLDYLGNKNLKWENSREFNMGTEAVLFNKTLSAEINYFYELRSNIIQKTSSQFSGVFGGLYPYTNWGKVANQGVEASVRYSNSYDKLYYEIGANVIFSKNEVKIADQINYPDSYLSQIGKSSDAMFGYVNQGLFGKDVSIDRNTIQTFGKYQAGDIAYADLNNDGTVDELDKKQLGNSYPRTHIGLDISLKYKGFGLYILGTAQLGVNTWLNNSYYWNYGEGKYSDKTLDRYHSENNPNGSYPRLTTTSGSNNFKNSDFWLENTSFLRLKNVELSYTFQNKNMNGVKNVRLFARGANLGTITKLKDLDPEVLNAGINNYPVLMTITGGVSVSF